MAAEPTFRVTVEKITVDEEGKELSSELVMQFMATHVDMQKRKGGTCERIFARNCNCASCCILARNMQKESTR